MLGTKMRFVTVLFLGALALASAVACNATIAPIGSAPVDGGAEAGFDLDIQPANSFSGVDGTHTFKAPIAVYRAGDDLTVTVSDPSVADIRPAKSLGGEDTGRYFVLTMKKVGTVDVIAKSNGKTTQAKLTVQSYAPTRFAVGEARYKQGPDGNNPGCASCHQKADGADHSPAALASVGDEEISAIITSGVKPGGVPIISLKHTWTATQTELDGLVTYLRALPPRGFQEQ